MRGDDAAADVRRSVNRSGSAGGEESDKRRRGKSEACEEVMFWAPIISGGHADLRAAKLDWRFSVAMVFQDSSRSASPVREEG